MSMWWNVFGWLFFPIMYLSNCNWLKKPFLLFLSSLPCHGHTFLVAPTNSASWTSGPTRSVCWNHLTESGRVIEHGARPAKGRAHIPWNHSGAACFWPSRFLLGSSGQSRCPPYNWDSHLSLIEGKVVWMKADLIPRCAQHPQLPFILAWLFSFVFSWQHVLMDRGLKGGSGAMSSYACNSARCWVPPLRFL